MAVNKAMEPAARKSALLDAGAKLASKYGAKNVTRRMVAQATKVSEALVGHYIGDRATAQKAYATRAKKLGLALPDAAKAEVHGTKLRAHKPKDARDTRPRSAKERVAITKKSIPTPAKKTPVKKLPGPTANKALSGPSENKSAARAPKAAPMTELAMPLALPLPLPPA